jgi:hypothetical protein
MLTIRDLQLKVFEEAAQRDFVEAAVAHIRKFFPAKSATQSDGSLRAAVLAAGSRAAAYGIESRYDVFRFINHIYALGDDFDTSSRFPWAQEILSRSDLPAERRMDILSQSTREELRSRAETATGL